MCFLAGSTLIEVGECERRLGAAEREFLQTTAISFLTPLRNFLEGDWRTISVSIENIFRHLQAVVRVLTYNMLNNQNSQEKPSIMRWKSKKSITYSTTRGQHGCITVV